MSKVEFINGSCLDQEVDVIVNAANKYLLGGSGICGAIFNKAGYDELTKACQNINTPLNDGDAVITPSFNIKNAKYIIHAVGPDFNLTPQAFDKLENAYYNSLKLLKENNLHSISFPLISSGIYGGNLEYPSRVSTECFFKAFERFKNDNSNYEITVFLCAFTQTEYKEVINLINSLKKEE